MMRALLFLVVVCCGDLFFVASAARLSLASEGKRNRPTIAKKLKASRPYFHTTDEIQHQFRMLAKNCDRADVTVSEATPPRSLEGPPLDVIRIVGKGRESGRDKEDGEEDEDGDGPERRLKAMLVFGLHARELLTVESALAFAKTLCGKGSSKKAKSWEEEAEGALTKFDFVIVPNANPISRLKVEDGDYCLRTNEHGVDLNRNFGNRHREHDDDSFLPDSEVNPGKKGFSEPESLTLKELAISEDPDVFLSVHTGAYLLAAPFGFAADKMGPREEAMEKVLKPISEKFCNGGECPYGGLADLIGYNSPGCDMDYMAESLRTPYAFTWEIYTEPTLKAHYTAQAESQRNGTPLSLASEKVFQGLSFATGTRDGDKGGRSQSLIQTSRGRRSLSRLRHQIPQHSRDAEDCWAQFNPPDEEEFDAELDNWTGAYLELCKQVVDHGSDGDGSWTRNL